ncbi:hypothetical protein SD51_11195 [Alicyclobacillus tengchongensis]|nr:hypothetical protein SD51_11195 [Alicyclobacillus tengchongensis]
MSGTVTETIELTVFVELVVAVLIDGADVFAVALFSPAVLFATVLLDGATPFVLFVAFHPGLTSPFVLQPATVPMMVIATPAVAHFLYCFISKLSSKLSLGRPHVAESR